MKFVFLHVGSDFRPGLLVRSIRRTLPSAEIVQCTNHMDSCVEGVDDVFILEDDVSNLMTYRLKAFSLLGLTTPAIYLDTDILITRPFAIDQLLKDQDLAVCKRTFGSDALINTTFKGMDLSEYQNKTFGEVYPYLASFNITRTHSFWTACHEKLLNLDRKFHFWYGDQEAMREVIKTRRFTLTELAESQISCLPEYVNPANMPLAVHFKGPNRKHLMQDAARHLQLA